MSRSSRLFFDISESPFFERGELDPLMVKQAYEFPGKTIIVSDVDETALDKEASYEHACETANPFVVEFLKNYPFGLRNKTVCFMTARRQPTEQEVMRREALYRELSGLHRKAYLLRNNACVTSKQYQRKLAEFKSLGGYVAIDKLQACYQNKHGLSVEINKFTYLNSGGVEFYKLEMILLMLIDRYGPADVIPNDFDTFLAEHLKQNINDRVIWLYQQLAQASFPADGIQVVLLDDDEGELLTARSAVASLKKYGVTLTVIQAYHEKALRPVDVSCIEADISSDDGSVLTGDSDPETSDSAGESRTPSP